jgi:hypothetical protein
MITVTNLGDELLLKKETTMHPELTQFSNWLGSQCPHSSVRKPYQSDLALL